MKESLQLDHYHLNRGERDLIIQTAQQEWYHKIDFDELEPELRKELIDRYQKLTKLNVDELDFYFGFNHWKSAAIIHGVYARYRAGQKSTDGIDLDEIKRRIDASLSAADFCIKRYKER
mgnify:CR=1 FL=1